MGKGKQVHPSPPAVGIAGETAEAVLLRLLPAAVMAMSAPLGGEAKEVLAYLVLSSLRSSAPATPAGKEEEEAAARGHRPGLACGCFACYTAYWSRWDGSPERERIHRAIEAFEDHLAKNEEETCKGRRRSKKRAAKKEKGKEVVVVETGQAHQEETPPPPAVEAEEEKVEVETATVAAGGEEERRRRGWGVVAGVMSWRGWGLWWSH